MSDSETGGFEESSNGITWEERPESLLEVLRRRKSLEAIKAEARQDEQAAGAKLGLLDLLSIGVGGTVGSGVFVLSGHVLPIAGPSAVVSWLLAGLICLLSSSAYMELSARLPVKGSCYVFSYHSLGEPAAIMAAVCLICEYGMGGAGVARSWSTELSHHTGLRLRWCYTGDCSSDVDGDYYFDFLALALTATLSLALCLGHEFGAKAVNVFTISKVILVAFVTAGGLICWSWNPVASLDTFAPRGLAGTLSATSLLFFGYVGFDEVCCMASRTKASAQTMPRALFGTVVSVGILSAGAQLALVLMVPPDRKSSMQAPTTFQKAFSRHGLDWAATLVSVGMMVLLPLVVFVSLMGQPELMAAMAEDGLVPPLYKERNERGVYLKGTIINGVVFSVVAGAVPFRVLWGLISVGVLLSFNLTNASLINVRYGNGSSMAEPKADALTWLLFVCMAVAAYALQAGLVQPLIEEGGSSEIHPLMTVVGGVAFAAGVAAMCTLSLAFETKCDMTDSLTFKAYGVPFLPGLAIFLNFFMMAQQDWISAACFPILPLNFFALYFFQQRCNRGQQSLAKAGLTSKAGCGS